MAILTMRKYPDPILRRRAEPVRVIDARLRRLAADMIETMREANGIGLAAPQVGEPLRLAIVDFDVDNHDCRVLVNPVVVRRSGRQEIHDEGCLSFPGVRSQVKRSPKVVFHAQDLAGETAEYVAEGLAARAVQHEIDHLDGLLFIDKVGPSDKISLRRELDEMEQVYAELNAGN